jgi:hypothetical protein
MYLFFMVYRTSITIEISNITSYLIVIIVINNCIILFTLILIFLLYQITFFKMYAQVYYIYMCV